MKADTEDALSLGSSHGSLGQRSLTSAHGSSLIHYIYDGCGIKAGSASPTPQSDKVEYCGIVPWRSYTAFPTSNPDGSLTTTKKPEGHFCSLCNSVFSELGWKVVYDRHDTMPQYSSLSDWGVGDAEPALMPQVLHLRCSHPS